jgi:molybdopterin/thiamine biosynthesis adenylyltransferase
MAALRTYLEEHAAGDLVPWSCQVEAAERFALPLSEVERAMLEIDLLPARYQRNRETVSTAGQLQLLNSQVAVIGCGGLGGYVIEELARLGVGRIVAIDPDVFEEHNLNRQILSTPATMGVAKVTAAAERVAAVNPAVSVIPEQACFSAANGGELLAGTAVAIDCLDNIPARLQLADVCGALSIPLVHGAIGGWYGHVATQFPGEQALRTMYGSWTEGKGIEQHLGNPSFTPAIVASLEVAEVCKILLGQGKTLRGRMLSIDLLAMEIHECSLAE